MFPVGGICVVILQATAGSVHEKYRIPLSFRIKKKKMRMGQLLLKKIFLASTLHSNDTFYILITVYLFVKANRFVKCS